MWYRQQHRRRPLPGRGHLVADRDRRHHDLPAARGHGDQARLGHAPAARHRRRRRRRRRQQSVPNGGGGFLVLREPWPSMLRTHLGRRPAVHRDLLVPVRRASTSPATARSGTTTATCGCSAGSTTSCWSPATTSPPPRSSRRWSPTRRWPSPRSSARPTRPPVRRSSRSSSCAARSTADEALVQELRDHVAKTLGPIAKPRQIMLVAGAAEDPVRARSCAGCCATSPRTVRSATSPRCRTPPSWT